MCMRVCACVCGICVICLYVCKCLYASSLSILNFSIAVSGISGSCCLMQDALSEQWGKKPVYVVGAATGSAVRSLGLSPLGEEIEQAPHYSIKYIYIPWKHYIFISPLLLYALHCPLDM